MSTANAYQLSQYDIVVATVIGYCRICKQLALGNLISCLVNFITLMNGLGSEIGITTYPYTTSLILIIANKIN